MEALGRSDGSKVQQLLGGRTCDNAPLCIYYAALAHCRSSPFQQQLHAFSCRYHPTLLLF